MKLPFVGSCENGRSVGGESDGNDRKVTGYSDLGNVPIANGGIIRAILRVFSIYY